MNPYSPPGYGHYPGPQGPYPDYFQQEQQMRAGKRLKTLAVVQLIFAGLGALGLVNSVFGKQADATARRFEQAMWSGELGTWMRVSTAIGFCFVILLAVAGFALLKKMPMGRTLTIAHGIGAFVFNVASYFITQSLMGEVLDGFVKEFGPGGEIFRTTFQIALLFGVALGSVFQVVELWVVTRPGVKEFLAQSTPPPYPM